MHILVPVDASTFSTAAGAVAIQLAKGIPGARVTALHVVNVRVASGNLLRDLPGHLGFEPAVVSAEVASEHMEQGKRALQAFAARAEAQGVTVHQEMRAGQVPTVISDVAADADLVVMGLRGETEEKFPGQGGRLAALLPGQVGTPLLLVPQNMEEIHGVALGYDGSTGAKHAVRALRSFAEPLGLPVHGIFVASSADEQAGVLRELEEKLSPLTVHRHRVVGDDPHAAILDVARREGAEVVALGFTGRSKLRDFAFGTLGEAALLEGSTAVLIA
jgi:nucleotide-binding universal stress UspA family protein